MILWTIHEEAAYKEIERTGVYQCAFEQSVMQGCRTEYDCFAGCPL